jgi:hypothetical protein
MTFDYYNNVPFQNDYPSDDQTQMQINCNSIAAIFDVDHIGFELDSGPVVVGSGKHRQITFNDISTPTNLTGQKSVFYTQKGIKKVVPNPSFVKSTHNDYLGLIKAFAVFQLPLAVGGATPTIYNSFNIKSVNLLLIGTTFTVVVTPVSLIDNSPLVPPNVGVIITTSRPYSTDYNYINNLQINSVPPSIPGTPNIVTVILLQN